MRVHAAANSMASGMRPDVGHSPRSPGRSPASSANRGRACAARSTNKRAASVSAREGTRQVTSPAIPRGSLLVATVQTPGAAASTRSTRSVQAPIRCSQLSSASTASQPGQALADRGDQRAFLLAQPERAGHHRGRRLGATRPSSTHHTPPQDDARPPAPQHARASRDLRDPPPRGRITSSRASNVAPNRASSSALPTKDVNWAGSCSARPGCGADRNRPPGRGGTAAHTRSTAPRSLDQGGAQIPNARWPHPKPIPPPGLGSPPTSPSAGRAMAARAARPPHPEAW